MRRYMGPAIAGVGVVAVLLMAGRLNSYLQHVLVMSGIYVCLAVSWNLIGGYVGQVSFGHAAFAAIGGYTSALLVGRGEVSPWLGLAAGIVAAAAIGYLLGWSVLRLSGIYLSLATFGFGEIVRIIIVANYKITKGGVGLSTQFLFGDATSRLPYVWASAALAALAVGIVWYLTRSRLGILLLSVREDEVAARALGVRTPRIKVMAFAVSAGMAGAAGGMLAHYLGIIAPSIGSLDSMSLIMAMTILGGLGTLWGPVVGAVAVTWGGEYFKLFETYWILGLTLMMIIIMRFAPGGIWAGLTWLGRRMGRRFAGPAKEGAV